MNRADMDRRGIEKNQWVDLISHFESETRRAERFEAIPYEIPEGCAAAYFPETNVLVPIRSVAEGSNQPASKSIVITVELSDRSARDAHKTSVSSKPVASLVAR
jgi:anaerobic selenocysteine-containing dehydrogenase